MMIRQAATVGMMMPRIHWSSCIAYYKLDEASGDAIDSVNGNDGTVSGATQGVTGKIGDAYSLDGLNDLVDLGSNFSFERTDEFSISCWMKTSVTASNLIFGKQEEASPFKGYSFYISGSDNKIYFDMRHQDSPSALASRVKGVTEVNDGAWHHIVVTNDGTGDASGMKVYIDGVDETVEVSDTLGSNSILNAKKAAIGSRNGGGSYVPFNGTIDEVSIFDKALSASEISLKYNGGAGRTYPG